MPLYRIGICELTWFLVPLQCKYPSWTEWRDFDLKRMLENVGLPDKFHAKPWNACGYQFGSVAFHPTPGFSVLMPHQKPTPRSHCLTSCLTSFWKLLRRRSHVRIVLGSPKARLADEISKELVRSGRFRPGPPRNTKTTFGWFFHLGICYKLAIYQWSRYVQLL